MQYCAWLQHKCIIHRSIYRKYINGSHYSRERTVWDYNRADWPEESYGHCQYSAFSRMCVALLFNITRSNPHWNGIAGPRCWLDGSTDHYIRWRNLVSLFACLRVPVTLIAYALTLCCSNSEASIRGVMIPTSVISFTLGIFVVFLFGSFYDWRTVTLICSSIPVVALFALYFVSKLTEDFASFIFGSFVRATSYCYQGSRDPNLVTVTPSRRRCSKSATMAARMGLWVGHPERAKRTQRIPRICQLLLWLPSKENQMLPSATNFVGENRWII